MNLRSNEKLICSINNFTQTVFSSFLFKVLRLLERIPLLLHLNFQAQQTCSSYWVTLSFANKHISAFLFRSCNQSMISLHAKSKLFQLTVWQLKSSVFSYSKYSHIYFVCMKNGIRHHKLFNWQLFYQFFKCLVFAQTMKSINVNIPCSHFFEFFDMFLSWASCSYKIII